LKDVSLNHQTGASAVRLAKSDPLFGSSDHFDSVAQKRLPLGAELQTALNLIRAHAWYASPSGALTFLNERGSDYLGLPKDHPIRLGIDTGAAWDSHISLLHPDDHEEARRVWSTCLRTGCAGQVSFRVRNAEGGYRWFLNRAEAVLTSNGTPLYWIGINLDIEDRKQAEFYLAEGDRFATLPASSSMYRDLQDSKARLEEAQRVAHVGHWEWDLETDVVVWSDETYRIFGLRPQERPMDLATVRSMVHPEDRDSLYRGVDEDLLAGVRPEAEFRIVLPSGEVRTVHSITSKLWSSMAGDSKRDTAGRPYKLFGTVQDITERRRAEEALERTQIDLGKVMQELRREQTYLAEAQSLTHIGSWACNFVTGQMNHLSDETFRLYGFDPSSREIPFESFYSATHPEDEPALREKFYSAIYARMDYDLEYRICRPDGTIRFIRSLGHHDPSQELGEYVGITMDITERKRAEEERERLRQLEADLAHTNRVNMMGELTVALAHEIKHPIAASITSANACLRWLARDPPDLERARSAAARIERHGNRAANVINRLQSFYKKGTPPEREMLKVKDVVREMTVLLRDEAVRHSITIDTDIGADVPDILADRVQLQQVFMNLILNAIEAMKDQGGELRISSRLDSAGEVIISVSDTGVGLPAQSTERIFEAFHTTKPQGTGMGLAITRSILESHGGRVWATRNQGTGATFHFTLPVEAEAQA
jgi:PAS domain S-box-containing protein